MRLPRYLIGVRVIYFLALASLYGASDAQAQPVINPQALYNQAVDLRKAKDYEGAIKVLDAALSSLPLDADCLALKSSVLRFMGRYELSEKCAQQAIEINPNVPWYYAALGFAAFENQDFEVARPALQKVIEAGASAVGPNNVTKSQNYLNDLKARQYKITWEIKPSRQMLQFGFISLPAPQTDLPYQTATWEIKGARSWETVQENGNTVIQVKPEGSSSFQYVIDAKVRPYSFKTEFAEANQSPIPPSVRPFLEFNNSQQEPSGKVDTGAKIREVAASVKAQDTRTTVENTVWWLQQHMKYKQGLFVSSEEAITRGYGDGGAYASIFTSLCRANGIPARTVWGLAKPSPDTAPGGRFAGHVWAEFYLSGYGWVSVEPQRKNKVGFTGSNRVLFYRGMSEPNSIKRIFSRAAGITMPTYTESLEQ